MVKSRKDIPGRVNKLEGMLLNKQYFNIFLYRLSTCHVLRLNISFSLFFVSSECSLVIIYYFKKIR